MVLGFDFFSRQKPPQDKDQCIEWQRRYDQEKRDRFLKRQTRRKTVAEIKEALDKRKAALKVCKILRCVNIVMNSLIKSDDNRLPSQNLERECKSHGCISKKQEHDQVRGSNHTIILKCSRQKDNDGKSHENKEDFQA
jgi:hypothetical protein